MAGSATPCAHRTAKVVVRLLGGLDDIARAFFCKVWFGGHGVRSSCSYAHLGWVLLSSDLFFDGPVVVVSVEGSVFVVIDSDGDSGFGDDVFESSHVSDGGFGGFELALQ